MKKAIVSLSINHSPMYDSGLNSANKYAKKIGCDYFIINKPIINYKFPHFEKLQLFSLFNFGYERILYLDRDTIVNPNARDIFEIYPDTSKFYAYDENSHPDLECMDRDSDINLIPKNFEWSKNVHGKYRYFNAGVMLFSKSKNYPFNGLNETPDVEVMWKYAEQTCFNYLIEKNKIKWESIDYNFNRMDLGMYDNDDSRLKADIIHYAGPCKYTKDGVLSKFHQMDLDYNKLLKGVSNARNVG